MTVQSAWKCSFISIVIFAFLTGAAAYASEIVVDTSMSHIELNQLLEYYEDTTGKLSINDIASESLREKFRSPVSGDINFGLTNSVYWVRLQLRQKAASPDQWVLEIPYTHLRYISLYEPLAADGDQGRYRIRHAGFSVPFGSRDLQYRQSAFPVTLDSHSTKTFYFRIQNNGTMWFPMTLWKAQSLAENQATNLYVLGIYFGLVFAMLFYNAVLFGTLRDIAYLYYVLYAAFIAMLFATITGISFQYLWPDDPNFVYFSPSLWTSFSGLFLALFTRSFLATEVNMPRADKLLRLLAWYWALSAVPLFLIQFYFGVAYFVYQVAVLVSMVIFLAIGFLSLRRGFAPARFYVLSFLAFMLGAIAFILRNAGFIPANYLTTYSVMVGSALEVILLGTALADRINTLKREKEAAQTAVVKNKEHALQVLQDANNALKQEIVSRMQIEASLFESREKYRVLFETLPAGVMVTDSRGNIIETNHASIGGIKFSRHHLSEMKNEIQLITPSGLPLKKRNHPAFRSLISGRMIENVELGIALPGADGQTGAPRWFSVTAAPMSIPGYGVIVIYIDITARTNLELQRRQQQVDLARASRFSTMGEMASALAHEINQPLGATLNYLYGITQRLENGSVDLADIRTGVNQSIRQIERAGSVIKHIHNFTHHHTPQVKSVDLNDLVRNIISFAEVDFRRFKTQLQTKLAKSLLPVDVNEIEIGQVILNLIKNGIDAMRNLPIEARILTIETKLESAQVRVTVHDRGAGISVEARARIFDAFFTTKSESLGLGLAVSRTIVQSHNGEIWAAENRGGACFQFVLPIGASE